MPRWKNKDESAQKAESAQKPAIAPEQAAPTQQLNQVRIDVWLWAARWFRQRKDATDAVRGGRAELNGQRTKPGKELRIGDRLRITKGSFVFDIEVRGLSTKRLGAKHAIALYEEDDESKKKREELRARLRAERLALPHFDGKGRPSKKDARDLKKLKGGW